MLLGIFIKVLTIILISYLLGSFIEHILEGKGEYKWANDYKDTWIEGMKHG
jgi:hypothetical protein